MEKRCESKIDTSCAETTQRNLGDNKKSESGAGNSCEVLDIEPTSFLINRSKTQIKNVKKTLRIKKRKAGKQEHVSLLPEDRDLTAKNAIVEKVKLTFFSLRPINASRRDSAQRDFDRQQKILEDLLTQIASAHCEYVVKVKRANLAPGTAIEILEMIERERNSENKIKMKFLQEQLVQQHKWETSREFNKNLQELKSLVLEKVKKNKKAMAAVNAIENKEQILKNIMKIKGKDPSDSSKWDTKRDDLVQKEIEISPSALKTILRCGILKRLDKVFGVNVARSSERSKPQTLVVIGLPEDIDEVVKFFREADFKNGVSYNLNNMVSTFIGKGGLGITSREEKFKCFYKVTQEQDVIIYGSKSAVEIALEDLKNLTSASQECTVVMPRIPKEIGKALTQNFQNFVKTLERKHKAVVVVQFSDYTDQKENNPENKLKQGKTNEKKEELLSTKNHKKLLNCSVLIKGQSRLSCTTLSGELEKFIKDLSVEKVDFTESNFPRTFFDSNIFTKNWNQTSASGSKEYLSLWTKLSGLVRKHSNIAFSQEGCSILLIGRKSSELTKAVKDIHELVRTYGCGTAYMNVPYPNSLFFTDFHLSNYSKSTGAIIRRLVSKRGDVPMRSTIFKITGTALQQKSVQKAIENALGTVALAENLYNERMYILQHTLEQDVSRKKRLEKKLGVLILPAGNGQTCSIIGSKENIEKAKIELENICKEQPCTLQTRTLQLGKRFSYFQIKSNESILETIRRNSKADFIEADELEMQVVVKGTEKACNEAEIMISDWIAANSSDDKDAFPALGNALTICREMKKLEKLKKPHMRMKKEVCNATSEDSSDLEDEQLAKSSISPSKEAQSQKLMENTEEIEFDCFIGERINFTESQPVQLEGNPEAKNEYFITTNQENNSAKRNSTGSYEEPVLKVGSSDVGPTLEDLSSDGGEGLKQSFSEGNQTMNSQFSEEAQILDNSSSNVSEEFSDEQSSNAGQMANEDARNEREELDGCFSNTKHSCVTTKTVEKTVDGLYSNGGQSQDLFSLPHSPT